MKKPNFYYHRYANFIGDMKDVPIHIVGAVMLLNAYAWMRWNPEEHPYPFLPNDDALLRTLCDHPRNWHRMRDAILSHFVCEDGKLFYPAHREDASRLASHHERKDVKRKNRAAKTKTKQSKPTAMDRVVAKQQQADEQEQRDEGERRIVQSVKEPAPAQESQQGPWDVAPTPEPRSLVYGLQGFRVLGWPGLSALLKHPTKLREAVCQLWDVKDTGTHQRVVKVFRDGKGFALQLPDGQVWKD